MSTVIVDTNVPVVANGRDTNASPDCRIAAIEFLEELHIRGCIAVDLEGEIEQEYRNRVAIGQPGVGSRFLQRFFAEVPERVKRFSNSTPRNPKKVIAFVGVLAGFDPSDRKFAKLSAHTGYTVVNATDTDWLHHRIALARSGVSIRFLCGSDSAAWFC